MRQVTAFYSTLAEGATQTSIVTSAIEMCEFKLKEEKIKRIFAYLAHLCTFMYLLSDPY